MAAADKKLAGASKDSFTKKCVNDASETKNRQQSVFSAWQPRPPKSFGSYFKPSCRSTQLGERREHRTDFKTVWGIWVHPLKPINQRDIFGTQIFLQFVHFLR